jgi:hypothetical protein
MCAVCLTSAQDLVQEQQDDVVQPPPPHDEKNDNMTSLLVDNSGATTDDEADDEEEEEEEDEEEEEPLTNDGFIIGEDDIDVERAAALAAEYTAKAATTGFKRSDFWVSCQAHVDWLEKQKAGLAPA